MSVKGKERSVSGSDSDLDFFTVKPSRVVRKASPVVLPSSSDEYESSDAENPDAEKRKKRRKKKRAKPPAKIAWLEEMATHKKGRGSTSSRERSSSKTHPEVVEILDSDDERLKTSKRRKPAVIELTPPPEMPESEIARLKQIVNTFCPVEIPETDTEPPSCSTRRSDSSGQVVRHDSGSFEPDERVCIMLRMVADPARRIAGVSERAIEKYEAKRALYVNRRDPLSVMIGDLADRLSRDPEHLVIEYDGSKVFRTTTPLRLGIQAGAQADMLGYELAVYERVLKQRQADKRRRLAEVNGEVYEEEQTEGQDESEAGRAGKTTDAPSAHPPSPPQETSTRKVIRIRGEWGELTIRAADNITAELLAVHFCKRVGHPGEAERIRLELDGERLEKDIMVGDMEIESGEVIDAVVIP